MAQTFSKQIELTDTTDGHKINYSNFGYTSYKSFRYFRINSISTGTISIKFGENDDWISIAGTEYPVIFSNTIAFDEIWIKPSETLDVNLIAFLV